MPMPRPAVMKVTDAAATQIRDILARAERPAVGVRVGLEKGGCAGMSYQMDLAHEVAKGDEVIETPGGRVLIDPKAVLYLLGSEMDFVVDKLSAKFVFKNPNEVSSCGCGESVQLAPAKSS
ncbi:MAG TPA: iron-sulfur cluster assembly accessory protein [Xanthobacteraceae bacterium]|nr:iron-sulfur cluster assembly accessory protein [Xanthobacteraceae bacterium]